MKKEGLEILDVRSPAKRDHPLDSIKEWANQGTPSVEPSSTLLRKLILEARNTSPKATTTSHFSATLSTMRFRMY